EERQEALRDFVFKVRSETETTKALLQHRLFNRVVRDAPELRKQLIRLIDKKDAQLGTLTKLEDTARLKAIKAGEKAKLKSIKGSGETSRTVTVFRPLFPSH